MAAVWTDDQLPIGLIAQFIKQCTNITEVIGLNVSGFPFITAKVMYLLSAAMLAATI